MRKANTKEKGAVLMAVLATIFVVIILANILMTIITSQSRLTHHKIGRIQAYYAVMSGINYAYEMLRSGQDAANWYIPVFTSTYYDHRLCKGCTGAGDINEPNLPASITDVVIRVGAPGSPLITGLSSCSPPADIPVCISATGNYTYTP